MVDGYTAFVLPSGTRSLIRWQWKSPKALLLKQRLYHTITIASTNTASNHHHQNRKQPLKALIYCRQQRVHDYLFTHQHLFDLAVGVSHGLHEHTDAVAIHHWQPSLHRYQSPSLPLSTASTPTPTPSQPLTWQLTYNCSENRGASHRDAQNQQIAPDRRSTFGVGDHCHDVC